MATKKERSNLMDQLLEECVNALLESIRRKACDVCGARCASAQDISNVIKFLHQNGFTIEPAKATDALGELLQQMEDHGKYPSTRTPS